ncbi:MAG: hypothetical protein MJ069_08990 [Salinivirgaceae bacterium]|nr:hypothetical protein [Salinivirgaceae bacterium]
MNKILLAIMVGLTLCQSNQKDGETQDSVRSESTVNDSVSIHFDVSYKTMTKSGEFTPKAVPLTDSLEMNYLSKGYNAVYENGGLGFMILLPKDTTVSRICNTKKFSHIQWRLHNELIRKIKSGMTEKALSDEVEVYFDVFFYYIRQEHLYADGGAVGDDGIERPDWGPEDNAPVEEYKLKDGKWVLSKYIPDRRRKSNLQFGLDKAKEILKARFGKMAEDMERDKTN